MYAHYIYITKTNQYLLLTKSTRPIDEGEFNGDTGNKMFVNGKRQARRIARNNHATPWNF